MDREQIQQLLTNFDYAKAAEAFLPFCSNQTLARLIKSGENSFTTKKLKEGLRKLAESAESLPDPPILPTGLIPSNSLVEEYRSAPAEVQYMISERIALKAQARVLKKSLHSQEPEERRDTVLEIVSIFQSIEQLWAAYDHWRQTGEVKSIQAEKYEEISAEDLLQLQKRYRTLKTYRNRPNWPKYETEYNHLESNLRTIGAL